MSVNKVYFGIVATAIALILGACQPPTINKETAQANSTILARADHGYVLTVRDYYDLVYHGRNKVEGGYLTDNEAKWLLDSLILDTLTAFAADSFNLGKYYSDNWVYKTRYQSVLVNEYYQRHVISPVTVDSAEVIEYQKTHPQMFTVREQALAFHIMASPIAFKNGADSNLYRKMTPDQLEEAVKGHIYHLKRLIDSGMSFQEVATRYSQDIMTKNQGGAMSWVTKGVYRPPFDSVLFALKPGQYSEPYRDPDGWHILMMGDYLAAGLTPIDRPMFYEQVKQALLNERQAAMLKTITDSLSKGVDVVTNEMVLDTDVLLIPDSLWVAVVNGTDTIDVQMIKTMDDAYRSRFRVNNTTANMKKAIIGSFVNRMLLVEAARRDGLDTLPDIKAQQHLLYQSTAKALLIRQWYDRNWQPSDSAIADYYKRHPKQFLVDKPLTVQQIVTKDSATALFLRDQAMAGVDFMELAREYYPGEPGVREALADLGKIGPHDVDSAFYTTAYGTPVGEVSMPIKSKYGYHIIKVLDHTDSKSLANARIDIVQIFTEQYRKDEMKKHLADLGKRFHLKYSGSIGKIFLEPVSYRTK
ncbi:hypothetical protein C3F09_05895 [candidate division GN15 bacterium]|uniref:PpiC domain-containing protein n=1 Tax=candidate division GN15 bacterium TaxID=2072418 RepID=A0A855X1B8_9BACT|nr:MAG: hypothetical protein C3F09_05895 [candidate division GN15 bacterium]